MLQHQDDLGEYLPDTIPSHVSPVVLTAAYNEAPRLPAFFNWYRRLGVKQFLVIDNASTDGTSEWLQQQEDAITLRTEASYAGARHGSIWFNLVMERMCPGQWVLIADADECLVYEDMETKSLANFTRSLEAENCQAVYTPLIDLYPGGNISAGQRPDPDDFLSVQNYFHDPSHYVVRMLSRRDGIGRPDLRGGPRMNLENPEKGPLLSKWSLFQYQPGRYAVGSHKLFPINLMAASPQAAMLHFKYAADQLNYLETCVEERRHGAYHKDYERYLNEYRQGATVYQEGVSCPYRGPRDLKPMLDAIQHARERLTPDAGYQRLSAKSSTQ